MTLTSVLQSQVIFVTSVDTIKTPVVGVIDQLIRDVVSRLSLSLDVIGCEDQLNSDWCISIRLWSEVFTCIVQYVGQYYA